MARGVSMADIILSARYLRQFAQEARAQKCAALIARANEADDYLRLTGMVHALYGDGSLSALALRMGGALIPMHLDDDFLNAFEVMFRQLGKERTKQSILNTQDEV